MPKQILLINIQGIGNNLMMNPMLKLLREHQPQARIVLLVYNQLTSEIWDGCPYLDEVITLADKPVSLLGVIRCLWGLRKRKFDVSITIFPANNYKFNLLAWMIGARERIGNQHLILKWQSLSFLQNKLVPLDLTCHDILQNVRLLTALDINVDGVTPQLELWLKDKDYQQAEQFLKQAGLEKKPLVGMHPGSSSLHKMDFKRWDTDKFAQLAVKIAQEYEVTILVFGGNDEAPLKNRIIQALPEGQGIVVQALPLKVTAALIGSCSFFVSNCSGLMHVAALMEVPVVAVFGPTDDRRTAPWGTQHQIVAKDLDCRPCWPLEEVGRRKPCVHPYRICLDDMSVEEVFQATTKLDIDWRKNCTRTK